VCDLNALTTLAAKSRPQAEDDSAGLVEGNLVIGLLRSLPPHRFVEGPSTRQV
jgi:hypothetical protein